MNGARTSRWLALGLAVASLGLLAFFGTTVYSNTRAVIEQGPPPHAWFWSYYIGSWLVTIGALGVLVGLRLCLRGGHLDHDGS